MLDAYIHKNIQTYIYDEMLSQHRIYLVFYVVTMTVINWDPPPQLLKALSAMDVVVVVGMVTFAQPQQEEQLQYAPTTDKTSINKKRHYLSN